MKLAIDPGHGMANSKPGVYDPGAVGGGLQEAAVALQWALTLKYVLTQKGVPCWLTRTDVATPSPLRDRVRRAVEEGCTHYLSVHCNSGGGTGVETFAKPDSDAFAKAVQQCAVAATRLPDRGVKRPEDSPRRRLAVLAFPGPACLLEIGFIDSPSDRLEIDSRTTRSNFATRLVSAL